MNFLSIDSKFYHFMSKVGDCIILSILWIIFSLPVITMGAATTTLYYSVVKVLWEDRGETLGGFRRSFKSNFKQSTIVTVFALLVAALAAIIGSAVYAANPSEDVLSRIYLVYLILFIFGVAWLHYIFSYIAKFQNTMASILKNSLIICLANFPQSAMIMILFVVVVVLTILLFPRSLGAMLFIPAVYTLVTSFVLEKIYKKYLPAENEPEQSKGS